jgi:hypothetical protein
MTNTNYKNACSILDDMTDAQARLAAHYLMGRLFDRIDERDVSHFVGLWSMDIQAEQRKETKL